MSDLFKSALSYIGSGSGSTATSASPPVSTSSEIIKLAGENVKLLKVIAEGGSSYVYGGQFIQSNLIIAVKKIPCQHDNEDKILSEIKFMNGFNHINIAKYHGYNKLNGVYWIGMEYCSSLRLPLKLENVGPVFGQIVAGVEYLHRMGITHWDLKFENCMLGRDQMIKLIDFGSASTQHYETTDLTTMQKNQLEDELFQFTTPMYRPPEILDLWSQMPIDYHVDLWALGCLLYYLVHTEHPFSDSNKLAIINCKYTKKPSIFQEIINGLLVINPDGRWSLNSVLSELKSMGIDYTSPVNLPFEELQLTTLPSIISNSQSSSILHSIRGGAESLFKNLKESSSRIYSSQQQPQGPPLPKEQQQHRHPPPQRPPPPKPEPPQVFQPQKPESMRTQLTGEDVLSKIKPEPAAFDLISDIGQQQVITDNDVSSSQNHTLKANDSLDLLGGFKDESIDFMSDNISVGVTQNINTSATKSGDLLDDLFGLNTVSLNPTPTVPMPAAKPETKKDPFDSLLTEQYSNIEKPPILPTSSSFSQLSALKVDNKNNMVKSTPNLNDLMFGDLLIDSNPKTTQRQGQSTAFGQQSNKTTTSGNSMGISFGRNPPSSKTTNAFTPTPNYNNSHLSGSNVPYGSSSLGSNTSGSMGLGFSAFSASTPSSYSPESSTPMQTQNKPFMGAGTSGVSAVTSDLNSQGMSGGKKLDLNAAFGELLNEQGFTGGSSTSQTNKTINQMRRTELAQSKSPEQLKVNDWVEGKRKNIRALLSTLHTVVWEGCSWKAASISVMVTANDVKKVYRRACLAIHPDKQRGEEWEELAKLIFVELNEAWNHFENDNFK